MPELRQLVTGLALAMLGTACTSTPQEAPANSSFATSAEASANSRIDVEIESGVVWIETDPTLVPELASEVELRVARGSTLTIAGEDCNTPWIWLQDARLSGTGRELESMPLAETLPERDLSIYVSPELELGPGLLRITCLYAADVPDTGLTTLAVAIVDGPGLIETPKPEIFPYELCIVDEEGTRSICTTRTE